VSHTMQERVWLIQQDRVDTNDYCAIIATHKRIGRCYMSNKRIERDEEFGPVMGSDQSHNYAQLTGCYTYTRELSGADYFSAGKPANGVEYYLPNDEDWGTIIAVHHESKLAVDTDFFEMDDIEGCPEEYGFILDNGTLKMGFES